MSEKWLEMEVHPTNNQVIYAIKENTNTTAFYKSTNNGSSFTEYSNGWPSPNSGDEQNEQKLLLAQLTNKVVAPVLERNGGSGLYGIYISEDQGVNWEFKCCGAQPGGPASTLNINMMGWQDDGSDDGGQYYYDLALAVNPNNANIIHVESKSLISTNGGDSLLALQNGRPEKNEYIHADIHDIRYFVMTFGLLVTEVSLL